MIEVSEQLLFYYLELIYSCFLVTLFFFRVTFWLLWTIFCGELGVLWCYFFLFWFALFEYIPWLPSQLSSTSVLFFCHVLTVWFAIWQISHRPNTMAIYAILTISYTAYGIIRVKSTKWLYLSHLSPYQENNGTKVSSI